MSVAYIALGSNVGDRLEHLRRGEAALTGLGDVIAVSPVYDTEPVNTTEGDRFLNAVVALRTALRPDELLSRCLDIEEVNGRVRSARNAPRTLDIDVLLYDELIVDEPELKLPHPRMHGRTFVLVPLADIAPDVVHPTLGISIRKLLRACPQKEGVVCTEDSL